MNKRESFRKKRILFILYNIFSHLALAKAKPKIADIEGAISRQSYSPHGQQTRRNL